MKRDRKTSNTPSEAGTELRVVAPRPHRSTRNTGSRPGDGLAGLLRRRQRFLLGVAATLFAAICLFTAVTPRTYESTALILVEPRRALPDSSSVARDRSDYGREIATEIELVNSWRVMEHVVDRLDLQVTARTSRGKRQPLDVFPAFSAAPDAPAGAYRLLVAGGDRVAIRHALTGDLIVTVSREFQFRGLKGTIPYVLPRQGIQLWVTELPRAIHLAQRRINAERAGRNSDLIRVTCQGRTPLDAERLCQSTVASYLQLRAELSAPEGVMTTEIPETTAPPERNLSQPISLPPVRVVDAATVPVDPASPNVALNLAFGFVLAITGGMGAALFQEVRDTRLRERRTVERQTGLPVLAVVPRLGTPGPLSPALLAPDRRAPRRVTSAKAPWRSRLGRSLERWQSPRVLEHERVAAECFRRLAADLGLAARAGDGGVRSVAITSPGRDEGKTLTACNVALVHAAEGARTLLVDADFRKGDVRRFFGYPSRSPGLSDVLAGSASASAVWHDVAHQSELWVMPAGTVTPHSRGLLKSPAFQGLIDRARSQFELVVLDTPPLNVFIDAAMIAAVVDAVVVVVREGKTEWNDLELTLARLGRAGGNVVGVVLNDVELPRRYLTLGSA